MMMTREEIAEIGRIVERAAYTARVEVIDDGAAIEMTAHRRHLVRALGTFQRESGLTPTGAPSVMTDSPHYRRLVFRRR